jgi:hypothetical protein
MIWMKSNRGELDCGAALAGRRAVEAKVASMLKANP